MGSAASTLPRGVVGLGLPRVDALGEGLLRELAEAHRRVGRRRQREAHAERGLGARRDVERRRAGAVVGRHERRVAGPVGDDVDGEVRRLDEAVAVRARERVLGVLRRRVILELGRVGLGRAREGRVGHGRARQGQEHVEGVVARQVVGAEHLDLGGRRQPLRLGRALGSIQNQVADDRFRAVGRAAPRRGLVEDLGLVRVDVHELEILRQALERVQPRGLAVPRQTLEERALRAAAPRHGLERALEVAVGIERLGPRGVVAGPRQASARGGVCVAPLLEPSAGVSAVVFMVIAWRVVSGSALTWRVVSGSALVLALLVVSDYFFEPEARGELEKLRFPILGAPSLAPYSSLLPGNHVPNAVALSACGEWLRVSLVGQGYSGWILAKDVEPANYGPPRKVRLLGGNGVADKPSGKNARLVNTNESVDNEDKSQAGASPAMKTERTEPLELEPLLPPPGQGEKMMPDDRHALPNSSPSSPKISTKLGINVSTGVPLRVAPGSVSGYWQYRVPIGQLKNAHFQVMLCPSIPRPENEPRGGLVGPRIGIDGCAIGLSRSPSTDTAVQWHQNGSVIFYGQNGSCQYSEHVDECQTGDIMGFRFFQQNGLQYIEFRKNGNACFCHQVPSPVWSNYLFTITLTGKAACHVGEIPTEVQLPFDVARPYLTMRPPAMGPDFLQDIQPPAANLIGSNSNSNENDGTHVTSQGPDFAIMSAMNVKAIKSTVHMVATEQAKTNPPSPSAKASRPEDLSTMLPDALDNTPFTPPRRGSTTSTPSTPRSVIVRTRGKPLEIASKVGTRTAPTSPNAGAKAFADVTGNTTRILKIASS